MAMIQIGYGLPDAKDAKKRKEREKVKKFAFDFFATFA
jgi:hypothetical protein